MSSHDWNGKRRWSYFCAKKVFFKGFACGFLAGVLGAIEDSQQGGVNALFALLLLGTLFSSKYSGLEIGKFRKVHVSWAWNLSAWRTSLLLEVSCNTTVVFLFLSSLKKLEIGAKMASSPLFRLKIGAIIGHPGDGKPKTQFPYCIDILLRRDQALPAALTKHLTGGKLMYLTANFIQFGSTLKGRRCSIPILMELTLLSWIVISRRWRLTTPLLFQIQVCHLSVTNR